MRVPPANFTRPSFRAIPVKAKNPLRLGFFLLPLAYVPLFVCLPNFSFPILHLFGISITRDSVNLHFSIAVCLAGAFGFVLTKMNRQLLCYIIFFLVWLGLSLVTGLIQNPSLTNVLFYVQTVLPLFAIVFGYQLIRNERDLTRYLHVSIVSASVAAVVLVVTIVVRYGPESLIFDRIAVMKDLAYGVPQFKSYFPLCVLATFSLALAKFLFEDARRGHSALIFLGMQSLFLPLCWSRSGLLGFMVCVFVQVTMLVMGTTQGNARRLGITIAVFSLLLPLSFAYLGSTFSARTDIHDLDNKSDRKRLELAQEGLQRAWRSPLFGDMFIPSMEERVGGEEIDVPRMFGAHNQWVDMLLRGGFIYVIAFGWMYWKSINKCRILSSKRMRRLGSQYTVFGVAGFSYLIAVAIAANFQLYFMQLQTATPIFLLLGLSYRVYDLAKMKSRKLATASGRLPPPAHNPRRRSANARPQTSLV